MGSATHVQGRATLGPRVTAAAPTKTRPPLIAPSLHDHRTERDRPLAQPGRCLARAGTPPIPASATSSAGAATRSAVLSRDATPSLFHQRLAGELVVQPEFAGHGPTL